MDEPLLTEAERAIMFGGVPLFVNVAGEDTIPAELAGDRVVWSHGRAGYRSRYHAGDLREVREGADRWYEVDDHRLDWDWTY